MFFPYRFDRKFIGLWWPLGAREGVDGKEFFFRPRPATSDELAFTVDFPAGTSGRKDEFVHQVSAPHVEGVQLACPIFGGAHHIDDFTRMIDHDLTRPPHEISNRTHQAGVVHHRG